MKTEAAFLAAAIVMLILSFAVYGVIWDSKSGGLNELQAMQEDVMYYYNVDIHINMLHIAVYITHFIGSKEIISLTGGTKINNLLRLHNPFWCFLPFG